MRTRSERRSNTWKKIKYRERIIREVYDAEPNFYYGHNLHKHNLTCNCYWCHIEHIGWIRHRKKKEVEFVESQYA